MKNIKGAGKEVLILERDRDLYSTYELISETEEGIDFRILYAQTVEEACTLIEQHPDLFAVSVGSKIPGNLDFVRKLRKARPSFPIIAASVMSELRKELVEAGCNYEVREKVLSLLGEFKKIQRGLNS